jgi:hypothetical protein
MRLWTTIAHVGAGQRTSNGAASAGVRCGSYADGQLIIHCSALGVGGKLTPYWQSSSNGVHWGDLIRGATMIATGVRIIAQVGAIGTWARARWAIATSATFSMTFVLKE